MFNNEDITEKADFQQKNEPDDTLAFRVNLKSMTLFSSTFPAVE